MSPGSGWASNGRTVIRFEFLRTLKKKSLLGPTLMAPIAIGMVLALVAFSGTAASRTEAERDEAGTHFLYLDESGLGRVSQIG